MFLFQFSQNISIPKIYHFFTFLQDRPWFLVLPFFLLFLLRRANFAKREAGLKRDAACENFCWSVGLNLRTSCLARSTDGAPWSFRAKWKQGREREWLNEWEWLKYTYKQTWLTLSFPSKTSDKDDLCQDPLLFVTLRRHGPRLWPPLRDLGRWCDNTIINIFLNDHSNGQQHGAEQQQHDFGQQQQQPHNR